MECQCCMSDPCLEAQDNAHCGLIHLVMKCNSCEQLVPKARWEAGYHYCMDKSCVVKALQERQANVRLILMPKQGFTYVFSNSDDLKHGKSSGR